MGRGKGLGVWGKICDQKVCQAQLGTQAGCQGVCARVSLSPLFTPHWLAKVGAHLPTSLPRSLGLGLGGNRAVYAHLCVLPESELPLLCIPMCPSSLCVKEAPPCPGFHVSVHVPYMWVFTCMLPQLTPCVPCMSVCVPCHHSFMCSLCSVSGFPAGEHRE